MHPTFIKILVLGVLVAGLVEALKYKEHSVVAGVAVLSVFLCLSCAKDILTGGDL